MMLYSQIKKRGDTESKSGRSGPTYDHSQWLCVFVLTTLVPTVFNALVPKEDTLSPRTTASISLHDNLQQLSAHSGFLVSMDQHERRGVTSLAGIIDSDHQEAIGFFQCTRSRERIQVELRWSTLAPVENRLPNDDGRQVHHTPGWEVWWPGTQACCNGGSGSHHQVSHWC